MKFLNIVPPVLLSAVFVVNLIRGGSFSLLFDYGGLLLVYLITWHEFTKERYGDKW